MALNATGLTVDACPSGNWQGAVFLRGGLAPAQFVNISSWTGTQYKEWLIQDQAPSFIPSAVFLGIGLVSGLVFISWRLVWCMCCMGCYLCDCCCVKRQRRRLAQRQQQPIVESTQVEAPSQVFMYVDAGHAPPGAQQQQQQQGRQDREAHPPEDAYQSIPEPVKPHADDPFGSGGGVAGAALDETAWPAKRSTVRLVQFFITFLALGTAGLTIWALTEVSRGLANAGWDTVDDVSEYITTVGTGVDSVLRNASFLVNDLSSVQRVANNTLQLAGNVTFKVEVLGAWLDSPTTSPAVLTAVSSAVDANLQNFTSAVTVLLAGLPTLPQAVSALANASRQVGAQGASQVTGANTTLAALAAQLDAMPQAQSRSAVTSLESSLAALNVTSRRAALAQLGADLTTLQAAVASSPEGSAPGVQQVLRAALQANASLGEVQVSLSNFTTTFKDWWGPNSPGVSLVAQIMTFLDEVKTNLVTLPAGVLDIEDKLSTVQGFTGNISFLDNGSFNSTSVTQLQDQLTSYTSTLRAVAGPLVPITQALAQLPPPADVLGTLAQSAKATSQQLEALEPALSSASAAVATYLASPSQSTYDGLLATLPAASNTTRQALAALIPLAANTGASNTSASTLYADAAALGVALSAIPITQAQADQLVEALRTAQGALGDIQPPELFQRISQTGALLDLLLSAWPAPRTETIMNLARLVDLLNALVNNLGGQIIDILRGMINQFSSSAANIENAVVAQIQESRTVLYEPTAAIDRARYIFLICLYSVCLLELVLLLLSMFFRCPALFTFTLFLLAVLVAFYFLIAFALAWGLSIGNDTCYGTETIALSFVRNKSPRIANLIAYYFFDQPSSFERVLADNGIIDIQDLDEAVTLVTTALFTNLTRGSFSPVGDFNASLRNTNASVFTTLGAKNVLLQELSFHDFSPLYLETKGFFCCKIPDEVYDVWVACTFGGWAMMVMCWFAYWLLRLNDLTAAAHRRCGCVWLLPPRGCGRGNRVEASSCKHSDESLTPSRSVKVVLSHAPTAAEGAAGTHGLEGQPSGSTPDHSRLPSNIATLAVPAPAAKQPLL